MNKDYKIKICGMKHPANIVEVASLLPDFLGFIFYKKSQRYFDGIIPELPKSIQKVGVFVDEDINIIVEKISKHQLDFVQLHGSESPEFCAALIEKNIKIIKTFAIDDDFDFAQLHDYEASCSYFLFDTKGKHPGGNGIVFNWDILKKYKSTKPLFLSGGIGENEIKEINKTNLPIFAIDINSKFENEPGLKNIEKLKKIL